MVKRFISSVICFSFIFTSLPLVHAQDFDVNQLPVPGTLVSISAPFSPLTFKGLIVNPKKPLEFQFVIDTGKGPQDTEAIKDQVNELVKYFLAGLTIPEGDLWVNLSPYEKDRIVPEALGQTDLGRDLLAQDYILKQLTASLIYPQKDLGKEFWHRVYAQAQAQFGTTNIPVNTFNKVWILPDQVQVYQKDDAAYVTKSTLKVMLDEDYLALHKHVTVVHNATDAIGANIVRAIILPAIEQEVNTGANFAPLRQIYQALILAKWYKESIQNGLLDAVYTNKAKVAGINLQDPLVKQEIYRRYIQAYKKGAFNYVSEETTPNGDMMPRKYFSGGLVLGISQQQLNIGGDLDQVVFDGDREMATVDLGAANPPDSAMLGLSELGNRIRVLRHAVLITNHGLKINDEIFRKDSRVSVRIIGMIYFGEKRLYSISDFDQIFQFLGNTDLELKTFLLQMMYYIPHFDLSGKLPPQILYFLIGKLNQDSEISLMVRVLLKSLIRKNKLTIDEIPPQYQESVMDAYLDPVYIEQIINFVSLVGERKVNQDIPWIVRSIVKSLGDILNQELSLEYLLYLSKEKIQTVPKGSYDYNEIIDIVGTVLRNPRVKNEARTIANSIIADRALVAESEPGGIDLDRIAINRTGQKLNVLFNRAELSKLIQDHFDGFSPVIININSISGDLPVVPA